MSHVAYVPYYREAMIVTRKTKPHTDMQHLQIPQMLKICIYV